MKNERDVEFTPDGTAAGQSVDFVPSPGLGEGGATGGSTEAFGTGTTGGYNAGSFGTGTTGGTGDTGNAGTMGNAGTDGAGTMEALRSRAGEGMDQAKHLVGQAQERAVDQVRTRLDSQKHRAADQLSSVAQTLRSSGQSMEGQEGISRYLTRAADEVENLAHYLEDREIGEMLGQVEDFARRQPVAFLGGAFTLGVLGARFLKSSRSNLGYEGRTGSDWNDEQLTSRVPNPERDAVGRPDAPGYAAPSERASSDYKAAGPRRDF